MSLLSSITCLLFGLIKADEVLVDRLNQFDVSDTESAVTYYEGTAIGRCISTVMFGTEWFLTHKRGGKNGRIVAMEKECSAFWFLTVPDECRDDSCIAIQTAPGRVGRGEALVLYSKSDEIDGGISGPSLHDDITDSRTLFKLKNGINLENIVRSELFCGSLDWWGGSYNQWAHQTDPEDNIFCEWTIQGLTLNNDDLSGSATLSSVSRSRSTVNGDEVTEITESQFVYPTIADIDFNAPRSRQFVMRMALGTDPIFGGSAVFRAELTGNPISRTFIRGNAKCSKDALSFLDESHSFEVTTNGQSGDVLIRDSSNTLICILVGRVEGSSATFRTSGTGQWRGF